MKTNNNYKNPIVPDVFKFLKEKPKKTNNKPKTLFNHPKFNIKNTNETEKINNENNSILEIKDLYKEYNLKEFILISLLDKFKHKVEKVIHIPTFNIFLKESFKLTDSGRKNFKINKQKLIELSQNKNFREIYSIFNYENKIEILSEPLLGGNLSFLIEKSGCISFKIIKFLIINILNGLDNLHKFNFSYNELNLQNILFSRTGKIKLNSPVYTILNSSGPFNNIEKDFHCLLFIILSCIIGEEIIYSVENYQIIYDIIFNENIPIKENSSKIFDFKNEEHESFIFLRYKYQLLENDFKNFLKFFFENNLNINKILNHEFLKKEEFNDFSNDTEFDELIKIFNFLGNIGQTENQTRKASKFTNNILEKLMLNINKILLKENSQKWFTFNNHFFINNIIFINEHTNIVEELAFEYSLSKKKVLWKIKEYLNKLDFIKKFKKDLKKNK